MISTKKHFKHFPILFSLEEKKMVNISKLISIYLCLIPYIIKDTTSHSAHICQFCKINSIENHMNYSIFKLTVIKSMRSMLRKSTQTSRDNNMTGRGQNCGRLLKCKVLLWVLTNQKVYCSKIIANHYSVQISMWNGLIQMENIFMEPKKTKSESDSLEWVFYLGTNLLTPMEYCRNANSPFLVHVFHGCLL